MIFLTHYADLKDVFPTLINLKKSLINLINLKNHYWYLHTQPASVCCSHCFASHFDNFQSEKSSNHP